MSDNKYEARNIVFDLIKKENIDIEMRKSGYKLAFKHNKNTKELFEFIYPPHSFNEEILKFDNIKIGTEFKVKFWFNS